MKNSPGELRRRSLILLAHARQLRADAAAARLRAVKCSTKAYTAALSCRRAQTCRQGRHAPGNTERHGGDVT